MSPSVSPDSLGSIFRSDAVRRHAEGKAAAVSPRAASPRMLLRMWLLLTVLVVGGIGTAWSVQAQLVAIERTGCAAGSPVCTAQQGRVEHAG